MKNKKILALAILIALLIPFTAYANEVNVSIEGVPVIFEGQGATIIDGRTLVPVRGVFEMIGFEVEWIAQTQTILMQSAGGVYVIELQIGSPTFTTNDVEFELDVPAQVIGGSTMLPIRRVVESIGLFVGWDVDTQTVLISVTPFDDDDHDYDIGMESIVEIFMSGLLTPTEISDDFISILSPEMQAVDFGTNLFATTGSLLDYVIAEYTVAAGMGFFTVQATHVQGNAVYTVVISEGLVIGMFFADDFDFQTVAIPSDASFFAEEVVIGQGTDWALRGILTVPDEASAESPVPAAILVHGSGAHNLDSSIFDNRPFWDIANYLSSNGIAVLRYDKRTLTHGQKYVDTLGNNATIWHETIYDAILAAQILQADDRFSEVYVIGLSLGGMTAPIIAQEAGLDGAILLAGTSRPLYQVQYDQNILGVNIALESGMISQEEANDLFELIETLLEEAQQVQNLSEGELANALIFGLPAIYQLSVMDILPIPIITANQRPTLILQGSRDWQVTPEVDFQMFLDYTSDLEHVTAILYENINHLFMYSQTPYNDMRDYLPAGNVYLQVLRDIVDWILSR